MIFILNFTCLSVTHPSCRESWLPLSYVVLFIFIQKKSNLIITRPIFREALVLQFCYAMLLLFRWFRNVVHDSVNFWVINWKKINSNVESHLTKFKLQMDIVHGIFFSSFFFGFIVVWLKLEYSNKINVVRCELCTFHRTKWQTVCKILIMTDDVRWCENEIKSSEQFLSHNGPSRACYT